VLIHLDTDIGGDIDDACALAMLLGLDDVELVGLTTNLDAGGLRAGMAAHYLSLAGRDAIPSPPAPAARSRRSSATSRAPGRAPGTSYRRPAPPAPARRST
jgi:inosine-uridine nucleoside N-ribohydrolase